MSMISDLLGKLSTSKMIKKLIFLAVLVSIFVIPVQAEMDSSKVFLSGSGFAIIPSYEAGKEWDFNAGFTFEGWYRVSDRITGGITYKDWKLKENQSGQTLTSEYKAVMGIYWVNEYGSPLNLGWLVEGGEAAIKSEEGIDKNLGIVTGMALQKYLGKKIYIMGMAKIGKFGKPKEENIPEQNCLMFSLGLGAAL